MTPEERAGLRQAIATDPGNMSWPSKTVSELLDDLGEARALVADYEGRICWDTTCGQCARTLDRAIADYERAERAEAEAARLRQEIVDARGETAAEATRADVAEAQRDEARDALAEIRTLVAKWAGPTTAGERILAGAILALTGGPWNEAPLTPGAPGYACGSLFTPAGEPRDEHSRHSGSPWCRGCVNQCREGGDGHGCAICATVDERTTR